MKYFEAERVEVPGFAAGINEAVFSIFCARFRLLEEKFGTGDAQKG